MTFIVLNAFYSNYNHYKYQVCLEIGMQMSNNPFYKYWF